MAYLNGYRGPAYVKLADKGIYWKGFIWLEQDPDIFEAFDGPNPPARVLYEGPVLMGKQYIYASGEAEVVNVELRSEKLMVKFEGLRLLCIDRTLPDRPLDFLQVN